MPFNLIRDAWIPVRMADGARQIIRPDQIAEPGVLRPDWPRADFNLACCELLIGLVYLADPPEDAEDWEDRCAADPDRLAERLAPLARAFDLDGPGPRFLQDLEDFDAERQGVDMLFIDSSGGNTARNNADLMVHRDRYGGLDAAQAAIALFTLQSQAPSGGAGNRTSMRGGGPMITLVDPGAAGPTPLWSMVWANVPDGPPTPPEALDAALPWMRPTRTSEKGTNPLQPPEPPDDWSGAGWVPPETFFGMPRRLRLDFDPDAPGRVIGVRQRPYGTNYGSWEHPLTPTYRQKAGAEKLPLHPRAGAASYRHWIGVSLAATDELRERARTVSTWTGRRRGQRCRLQVGGWAMDNMKPRDFVWSSEPLFALSAEAAAHAAGFVEAANAFSLALNGALMTVTGAEKAGASAVEAVREAFFLNTQVDFEAFLRRLETEEWSVALSEGWRDRLAKEALALFDERALPGLFERPAQEIEKIVEARGRLVAAFKGYGDKTGRAAFAALDLPLPQRRKKKEEPA